MEFESLITSSWSMVVKVKLFEVSNRLRGRDRKVLKINEDTGQILITVNKQAAGRQWCTGSRCAVDCDFGPEHFKEGTTINSPHCQEFMV